MRKAQLLALGLAAGIATFAAPASAAVVCNEEGDCWRVKRTYHYRPEFRLKIYDDDWRWDDHEEHRYRWRESHDDGLGYWRDGVWITF
jgi:hypothetical protein